MIPLRAFIAMILFFCVSQNASVAQNIIISEILASNASKGMDDRSKTADWIELTNTTDTLLSLKNWRISDKSNYSKAFVIPDTTLAPGQCLVVWATNYIDTVPQPTILTGAAGGIGRSRYNDAFHFLHLPVKGDFVADVRIHSIQGDVFPEAGLIIREKNEILSRYAGIFAQSDGRATLHLKPSTNPDVDRQWFFVGDLLSYTKFPYAWLRLQRIGDTIVVHNSLDSFYWFESPHYYFPFKNDSAFVGLAFVSGSDSVSVRAGFSSFRINGRMYSTGELRYSSHDCRQAAKIYPSHEIHAPFGLSRSGETVYLWDESGVLHDSLHFGKQRRNISYGVDGLGRHGWFAEPTPGHKNPLHAATGVVAAPVPVMNSGYVTKPIVIRLAGIADSTVQIHYTTDFSIPTELSPLFGDSLRISKNTTIRLRGFSPDRIPSTVMNRTFIFDASPSKGIATIFLTAEHDELWSASKGIWSLGLSADTVPPYWGANFWGNREAPVHVELNDGITSIFSADMGAKNHGYGGRFNDQKPLDIQTSSPYGDGDISGVLFPEKPARDFEKLLLRNGSQDWKNTLLRDPIGSLLALRSGIDAQGYRPVRVYVNSSYWGIYQLREKSEESFIASNYSVNEDAVEMIGVLGRPLQGSSAEWNASVARSLDSTMSDDSVFAAVMSPFDMHNLITYWAFEIFALNIDWPGNNLKVWRAGAAHPKWRYITIDNDLSFENSLESYVNMFDYVMSPTATSWANPPEATAIFRGCMQNTGFKHRFLSTTADYLNTVWSAPQTTTLLDSLAAQIAPEIPLHQAKWPSSALQWDLEVLRLRKFFEARPNILRQQALTSFGLRGLTSLSLKSNLANAGGLTINSLSAPSGEFSGIYFRDIPVEITANPNSGYEFIGWINSQNGTVFSTSRTLSLLSDQETVALTAVYHPSTGDSLPNTAIVINEFMYKAPDSNDTKDWIEIYNHSDELISLSGWMLKDDDDSHIFTMPAGTIIAPRGYIVVAEDTTIMRKQYLYDYTLLGELDFGYGRGDMVRLYNAQGILADSVRYERFAPWPIEADGAGSSLELLSPELDNTLPQNWRASLIKYGTPGKRNSVTVPSSEQEAIEIASFTEIMPNPSSGYVVLKTKVPSPGEMQIEIIDCFGSTVWRSKYYVDSQELTLTLPTHSFTSGLYRCVISSPTLHQIQTTPFVMIK
ncbi:MAG: lamin tail domain-containing protein [Ignavibacteria bacterium]|nr:lamin tail domain-containing protein [Ignavibacteria bacterium]